jgi:cephalosporin hydroxylase
MFNKESLENIVKLHPDSFPAKKLLENFDLFEGIHTALSGKWVYGWGSYLIDGISYDYKEQMLKKQEELYRYAMTATNVLEIGVYVGHSLLIMLLANPNLKITAIDCDNTYAEPAIKYLNSVFGERITFIHSDAITALKNLPHNEYDLIHIDADHTDEAVKAQFNASWPLAKQNAYIIFDDYDAVHNTINELISNNTLKHIIIPDCSWRNCVTQLNKVYN